MPSISGLRRRGIPAAAIRDFAARIGVSKSNATQEAAALDACVRDYLNQNAERRMAVLKPLKLVIENYPEGSGEMLDALNNPNDESAGKRQVPFARTLYIEADDFMEEPVKKFFRLAPGREVRLRYAYFIICTDVIKDAAGNVTELRCTYDPETKGGNAPDGRKVKATLHWVSADHALDAEARLYDHLFAAEEPGNDGDFLGDLNPESLEVLEDCKLEPALGDLKPGETVQFERLGYFCPDPDGTPDAPVFNRTLSLRDSWAKAKAKV
jgi:glutaminyl-tRNA synthetase